MSLLAMLLLALLLPASAPALQNGKPAPDLLGAPLPAAAVPGDGHPAADAPTGAAAPLSGAIAPGAAPVPAGAFVRTSGDRLEFHARGLALADAFAELRRLMRRNIVVAPDVTASFTGDLYDMTVEEIITALCRSTGMITREEGSFIYIEPDKAETRIFTLGHARAEDAIALIRPLLSPQGQVTATPSSKQGIASSQEEAGGDDYAFSDLMVVRDLRSRLDEIAAVLVTLDAAPQQVLIEATILSVSLSDNKQLGVEFSTLLGVDFQSSGATSPDGGLTLDPGALDGDQLDTGVINTGTGLNSFIPKANGGLDIGILKNGVGVFIKALQTETDATVLANPRIVTMNKQRGEVLLGRRDGFLTTTVTQTSTTQTVDYLETGTRLIFRPFITGKDLVRLEIHPEDSTGGLNSEGLPFKETAEVTTNIMIRDGETVVIGGLFRERKDRVQHKVPLLGDIPLLGGLFRSEDTGSRHEEIIIVLTPHIVNLENDKLHAKSTELFQSGSPTLAGLAADAGWTTAAGDRAGAQAAGGSAGGPGASGAALAAENLAPDPRTFGILAEPRLAEVHLALVRSLLARGDADTAAMLLAGIPGVRRRDDDVRALELQLGARQLPLPDVGAVDRQLLDLIAATRNSR
ncbi:MAG TPA: hypothetical protein VK824_02075 [Planctomycetota bacterium]|nr:hypothetical protein [Planctomycetota bacterium]